MIHQLKFINLSLYVKKLRSKMDRNRTDNKFFLDIVMIYFYYKQ